MVPEITTELSLLGMLFEIYGKVGNSQQRANEEAVKSRINGANSRLSR